MSDFAVRTAQLNATADELDRIQRTLNDISGQVSGVLSSTRRTITARISASLSRSVLCTNINNCAVDMSKLSQGLRTSVQYYLAYEKNVADHTFGKAVKATGKKSGSASSKIKNCWDFIKKNVRNAVTGTSKAIQKKAKEIKSAVKKGAEKAWNSLKKGAGKAWNYVKDSFKNAKSNIVTAYNYLKENYNNHGLVYDIVQYGKAAVSIVGSTAAIVAAVASIAGSGGLSTPAAIATIIYSVNGIANSVTDIYNVANDNYDQVGNVNYMKTGLSSAGGWVGKQLGNEQLGEALGTGVYYAGSLYTTFANVSNSISRAKQIDNVKVGDAWTSLKKLGSEQVSVKNILTSDVNQLRLQYALLKKSASYKPLFDFAGNAITYSGTAKKIADFAMDSTESLVDVINIANNKEYSVNVVDWYKDATSGNAVTNTYNDVTGTVNDAKDIFDTVKTFYGVQKILRAK